jgi:hypothetical protein
VVNVTVELPHSTEDTSVDLQVIATSPSNDEQLPVPIEVQGRSGAPGLGAIAAALAIALVATAGVAASGRRRR